MQWAWSNEQRPWFMWMSDILCCVVLHYSKMLQNFLKYVWGCIINKFKCKYPQKLFPLQCDNGPLSGLPRYLRSILLSCCKLPQTVQFLTNCRQKKPFWNTHQNLSFTRALGFSSPLAYPKYFSFLVSACLLIDPISQISISAELSAPGLMMAFFEACVVMSETQATGLCCLLERAIQIALHKCLFSVVFYLTSEGSRFLSKALVWGLESCRWGQTLWWSSE